MYDGLGRPSYKAPSPATGECERRRGYFLTRTNFMMRPETFQSCTYKLPCLSQ